MIWRFDTRRDFEQLRRGRRRRAGPLTITMALGDSTNPPKVAFAIGRKVGSAPRRNQLRRRMRAILAAEASHLVRANYLISARPGATELTYEELRNCLMQALNVLDAFDAPRENQQP